MAGRRGGEGRQEIHPYIFMEGRVKSFLLCLGDGELVALPQTHTHTHRLHTHIIEIYGGHIPCPLIFIKGQTFKGRPSGERTNSGNGCRLIFLMVCIRQSLCERLKERRMK